MGRMATEFGFPGSNLRARGWQVNGWKVPLGWLGT